MDINRWILIFTVTSIAILTINLPIARGEAEDMNQESCDVKHPNSNVPHKTSDQTEREVLDYWTPERMQNAKPLMPTVPAPKNFSSTPQSNIEQSSSSAASPPSAE